MKQLLESGQRLIFPTVVFIELRHREVKRHEIDFLPFGKTGDDMNAPEDVRAFRIGLVGDRVVPGGQEKIPRRYRETLIIEDDRSMSAPAVDQAATLNLGIMENIRGTEFKGIGEKHDAVRPRPACGSSLHRRTAGVA